MKSYRVIYLLEYIRKILEKVVANKLSRIYEERSLLYVKQINIKKNKSAIDVIILFIYEIQGRQKKGEKAVTLFIDVKDVFDHVSKKKLTERITNLRFDEDLVGQT